MCDASFFEYKRVISSVERYWKLPKKLSDEVSLKLARTNAESLTVKAFETSVMEIFDFRLSAEMI
jgi:hypothetical protein